MKVTFRRPQLHVSELSGKLDGIAAISSSALANPYCVNAVRTCPEAGSICQECYAWKALSGFRACMAEPLARNTALLQGPMHSDELPRIYGVRALRFNSHGELGSVWELDNFNRIAILNRHLRSALWTKRLGLVEEWRAMHAFEGLEGGQLELDMRLVLSSPQIGVRIAEVEDLPYWVDRVYTVYRTEVDLPKDAWICEGHCADCMVCYEQDPKSPRQIATVLHR